jgi:hypothetical protein
MYDPIPTRVHYALTLYVVSAVQELQYLEGSVTPSDVGTSRRRKGTLKACLVIHTIIKKRGGCMLLPLHACQVMLTSFHTLFPF